MSAAVLVFLVLAGGSAWWLVDVQRRPMRRCPRCKGTRTNAGSTGIRWGTCRRCGGKGSVRRFGAGTGQ